MIVFPNAKINLGLNIESKREDGYHNISSCFYPIPFRDCLEIVPSEVTNLEIHGLDIPGESSDNLILKAYQLIKRDHDIGNVEIHLLKNIPMGAGLGGGSADCAFMINLLNDYYELNIPADRREKYAAELGSDCAFFIRNQPAIATGRGEVLREISLNLSGYHLKLICPDIHIGTAEAYANVTPSVPEQSIESLIKSPVESWKGQLKNDFEESIFPNHPELSKIKQDVYDSGALYASMTGSGSAFYGLFKNDPGDSNITDHKEYNFSLGLL